MKIDRSAGAEAISQKAIAIAADSGVTIIKCIWDLGEDLGHEYAHRLELSTEAKTVRLYFPDLELTTTDSESRKKRTDDRLRNAIAQLSARPPSPTYAYR